MESNILSSARTKINTCTHSTWLFLKCVSASIKMMKYVRDFECIQNAHCTQCTHWLFPVMNVCTFFDGEQSMNAFRIAYNITSNTRAILAINLWLRIKVLRKHYNKKLKKNINEWKVKSKNENSAMHKRLRTIFNIILMVSLLL